MPQIKSLLILVASFTSLGAGSCGPVPPDPPGPEFYDIFDGASSETSPIETFALNGTNRTVSVSRGDFDRETNEIEIAGLPGTISLDRLSVSLGEGGLVTIERLSTDYATLFSAEPRNSDPFVGVIGVQTVSGDLPSGGIVEYSGTGTAGLQIIDSTSFFELIGDVDASVDFGANQVDLTFSSLAGQRTDGVSDPVDVSDVAIVEIDNALLAGGSFSGGDASFQSSAISTVLSGLEVVSTSGGLFGPTGDEIGGVILIDDTSGAGTLLIQGAFVAD